MKRQDEITIIPDGFVFGDIDEDIVIPEPTTRSVQEIVDYEEEAFEKVWLARAYDFETKKTDYEVAQQPAEEVLQKYNDIPENGYSDWEYGFWSGVLATLRWVLGEEEKDFLDT